MNFLGPIYLLNNVAVSSTTAYPGTVLDVREQARYSLQVVAGDGASGSFLVQGSLNYGLPGVSSPTWDTISGVSLTALAGLATSQIIDIPYTGIPYIQVTYTNTGGSGNVTVLGFAKMP